ncbi:tankyrase-1-like [Trichogramma pretiosum]|uniref:tankyrase-1-like n=1 Tax=Trichogramma pretiosum TaxID=7493 RepID=UPI000C719D29|nr:tankyrase-1-like [Trichogramma pretiosum]
MSLMHTIEYLDLVHQSDDEKRKMSLMHTIECLDLVHQSDDEKRIRLDSILKSKRENANYLNQAKLQVLREKVNWETEAERRAFLRSLDFLIRDRAGQLPNFKDIFSREEMDLLLSDALKPDDFHNYGLGSRFISCVLEAGYKDEPDLDEAGKPVLRRTTPVHRARSRDVFGWETTIRKLFKIYDRFDANYRDESGLTHFHVACELGLRDIVSKYLDQGQDPDCLSGKSDSVDPPLHLALANNERNVVSLLLRHGADPNSINEAGETPLHVICRRRYDDDDDELLKIFFGTKAKLDVRDKRGDTPLHLALVNYRLKLVELLLRRGADPNVPNEEGSTPLHVICKSHRFHHFMETLFDVCDEVRRPLWVNARDESGRTPLHLALDGGAEDKVELLLRRGRADPNSADDDGSTPLHVICTRGDADYFAELFFRINDELGQRVRIDSVDGLGRTPLQLAVAKIFPGLVEILLDRGVDLSKFVFPTERQFEESLETFEDKEKTDIKFEIASDMLEVLECLEKNGYELTRSDALTLIKFFVEHGLFEISSDLEERWYDAKRFAKKAKKIAVRSNLSLYDLVRLRPKEATRLLTVSRYCELAYSDELRELRPERCREACMTRLSEKMWRGFFRRWTPEFLFALARRRLPIPCCDLIFDRLTMEDWLRLCLAAEEKS